MASLEHYLDERLAHGRSYFVGDEARSALGVSQRNFAAAVTRLINKGRLANPRHGFFLILRPEDRVAGAPDPVRWIDPLLKHQRLASAGDLLMVTVLRRLNGSGLLDRYPNLSAYVARGETRPAYKRAFADQLAVFTGKPPTG